jgi:translocation and assembly module TamA
VTRRRRAARNARPAWLARIRLFWATLGLALLLGACASVEPAAPARGSGENADTASLEGAPETGTRLRVDAPAPLRQLLLRYLDLARLAAMREDEAPDDVEWLRLIAAAPAQVRELLQTEGYFNPQVQVRREPGPPQVVHVRVVPGPRARIVNVVLHEQGALHERALANDEGAREAVQGLHAWWPLPPGAEFRNGDWSSAKNGALARVRAAGYASVSIAHSAAQVDAGGREVALELTIDSGPLYVAGDLRIEGQVKHDDAVVRNLAGFGAGEPLTEQLLLDYQDRLRKSGLFDSAVITFDNDPAHAPAAAVTVQVRELPLHSLTLGVGVSANPGPRATAEHTFRRIFGHAATLHNKIEYGRDRQLYEGELSSHPGERFYRNLLGAQLERLVTDLDVVSSQRVRVGRTQDTQRIERLYFVGLDRSLQTTSVVHKDARAYSVQYHLVWRDVDSVILPTRGLTASGQIGFGRASSNYAETGLFTRAYARVTGYLPFGTSWYGSARLEAGQVFKRDAVAIPDALAFRAGGDDSVRGYAYRTLAPVDADGVIIGGNVLATGSIELARPLSSRLPNVWGAVFIDAGRAALSWTDFKPALGYGVGVRWRSPVGPLRVDLAYGEELRKLRLHLSVGIAF